MDKVSGRLPEAPGSREPSPSSAVSAVPASIPSAWPEVEWEEGYPTAEDDDFAAWGGLSLDFQQAAAFLLRELPRAAENCCAWCEVTDSVDELFKDEPVKRIEFSTGGWSGAESLIDFIGSRFDTRHFMESWRRGGHYVFEVPMHFLASGIEAGTDETAEQAQPKARARPDAQPSSPPPSGDPS